ncbi:MAG: DUF393 domain-containing protein [Dehalococcoidia bacterium]|nr:DUF393 domain-containing protein [Dehalococcoidia bacterium]
MFKARCTAAGATAARRTGRGPHPRPLGWGDLRFCRACARLIQRLDRHGRFEVVPHQDAPWPPMTQELYDACQGALHVRTQSGRLYRGGDAVIAILRGLGRRNLARVLMLPGLRQLVHLGYRAVAANRARLTRLLPRSAG